METQNGVKPRAVVEIILVIVIVAVGIYLAARYWRHADGASYSADSCVPAANEECPSDQWYRDWQHLQALNAEIAKEQQSDAIQSLQSKMDTSLGLAQRLRQMIPAGSEWKPEKKRFVKSALPAGMPSPPPTPGATK